MNDVLSSILSTPQLPLNLLNFSSASVNSTDLTCFPLLSTGAALNVAYPNYLLSSYNAHLLSLPSSSSHVEITGSFPNASFVEFTAYDLSNSYEELSSLVDFQLVPDRDGVNPFLEQPPSSASPSSYTIRVSTSPGSARNELTCSSNCGIIMRVFKNQSVFDPVASPVEYIKDMAWGNVEEPAVAFWDGASSPLPGSCDAYRDWLYETLAEGQEGGEQLTNEGEGGGDEPETEERVRRMYNQDDNWVATVGDKWRSGNAPLVNPLGSYLSSAANATHEWSSLAAKVTFLAPTVSGASRPIYDPRSHQVRFGAVVAGNRAGAMQAWSALSFGALSVDGAGIAVVHVVGEGVELPPECGGNVLRWPVGGEGGETAYWPAVFVEQYLAQSQRVAKPEFVSGIADVAGGGERAVEIGMGEYAPSIRYYKNYNEMC